MATDADLQTEERAIRTQASAYNQAVIAGDVDALLAFYSEDAVLMPPATEPVRGHAAIRAYYEMMLQFPNREITSNSTRIEVARSADLAYETGDFAIAADSPEGRIRDSGRYLAVWKKFDGQWRMAVEMSQSDARAEG